MFEVLIGKKDGELFRVLHMVLYKNQPTEADMQSLKKEIATDKEFGLIGEENLLYKIRKAKET